MELRNYFSKFLKKRKKSLSEKDYYLSSEISKIIGVNIRDVSLYREAFSLKSSAKKPSANNYERLEFLGDSILGSIISCHLYTAYPEANEGFLTQMKSKIVNRKNLNKVGEDLKITKYVQNSSSNTTLSENLAGNLFESLIGAVYLDLGYSACENIVLQRLLTPSEIIKLENKIVSYKGLILEWSQKNKVEIRYETCEEILPNKQLCFRSTVWLAGEKIANASESSKKKAEEKAAQRAFYVLNKKENIIGSPKNTA